MSTIDISSSLSIAAFAALRPADPPAQPARSRSVPAALRSFPDVVDAPTR